MCAHHVAVGKVYDDKVVLVALDSVDEFVLNLKCAHLGLQVVSSHLGRGNQDTVFAGNAASRPPLKKSNMGILLGFSDMKLILAKLREVFGKSIAYIFLVEEDMDALERRVVRSHAIILKAGDSVHSFFWHIVLGGEPR